MDEAVSLVSYHLRKMAAHGFIVEAPEERRRARALVEDLVRAGFSFHHADFDDRPEGVAVLDEVTRQLLATRRALRAVPRRAGGLARRVDAGRLQLRVHAAADRPRTQELADEIVALMARWADHGRAAEDAGDAADREHVSVQMYGFPFRP